MRSVVLLRHGQAASTSSRGDAGRVLTAEGQQQADAAGRALSALGMRFDTVWHSPFVRARQTWEAAAAHLSVLTVREDADITPHGVASAVAESIFSSNARSLLVVSHLPLLPEVASVLLGGGRLDLGTGSAVRLMLLGGSRAPGSCVLTAHLPADALARIR